MDDEGRFTAEVSDYAGRLVFDANNEIVADLDKYHKLFRSSLYTHKYPHCWRTDVPIIYRAMSAWFIDVPKIKGQLLKANKEINWYPSNVQDGATQEGQGSIPDREFEHLGASDASVVVLRQIWARELRNLAQGISPKQWSIPPVRDASAEA